MFIVLLKFSSNKGLAGQLMDAHNAWLKRGFEDGVFLLAGSLQPKLGGAILAHQTTVEQLRTRVFADPFVEADVVAAEILEVSPSKVAESMAFLMG
jgi:uncharacterized protein YciI